MLGRAEFDCSVRSEGGEVVELTAHTSDILSVFWTRDRKARVPETLLADIPLALLHDDYVSDDVRAGFGLQESYFRLKHEGAPGRGADLPPGFSFAQVTLPGETAAVADLIGRCYPDLRPREATVGLWTRHPVFSPDLWIWVMDRDSGERAALGIAELDPRIGEGSLEWIQVLPGYRGRGLGATLVLELLRRLGDRAASVTVSGRTDSASRPERLYRRCGFEGDDVWWMLRRS